MVTISFLGGNCDIHFPRGGRDIDHSIFLFLKPEEVEESREEKGVYLVLLLYFSCANSENLWSLMEKNSI